MFDNVDSIEPSYARKGDMLIAAKIRIHIAAVRYRTLFGCFAVWRERSRQRNVLAALDDHLLDDIGIDRNARTQECRKWFWEA